MRLKLSLILLQIFITSLLNAQHDTTLASRNVIKNDFTIDSSGILNQKPTKDVGNKIQHLVIFNLSFSQVNIKLSVDGQKWTDFLLQPITKHLYRCDNIQRMFIIIDPTAAYPVKAKIYRSKKYNIFFDDQLNLFDIQEIP
jgi:hypothetical protein